MAELQVLTEADQRLLARVRRQCKGSVDGPGLRASTLVEYMEFLVRRRAETDAVARENCSPETRDRFLEPREVLAPSLLLLLEQASTLLDSVIAIGDHVMVTSKKSNYFGGAGNVVGIDARKGLHVALDSYPNCELWFNVEELMAIETETFPMPSSLPLDYDDESEIPPTYGDGLEPA